MNVFRFCQSVAIATVLLLAGCATVGHPCFSERVMFADKSTSCQYGRAYHCDNGDWIAYQRACSEPGPELSPVATLPGNCEFAGISFASGSATCRAGRQYRCENGSWRGLDLPCSVGDAPITVLPRGENCSYEGTTVASGSAVCRSGTTVLCNNGQWTNLGTACR